MSTKSIDIIITKAWYSNCLKDQTNWFDVFIDAYKQLTGESVTETDLVDLAKKLDKYGINTNRVMSKLYGCIYHFYKDTPNGSEKYILTGFFDTTSFLRNNYIKNDDDLQFFLTAIKQFINNGGLIRVGIKDFLIGEDMEMEKEIKTFIWHNLNNNN